MFIRLDPDVAHVWYTVTDTLDDAHLAAALTLLSADELARHARFVFDRDRRDFAAAHALTRRVLSLHADVPPHEWTFDIAPRGKPSIAARPSGTPALTFNLSHTRGLVACAVARDADIGVDVERVDRSVDVMGLAKRHFSSQELAGLAALPEERRATRFVEIWTLKEAFIKATGDGLAQPLDSFGFAFGTGAALTFIAPAGLEPQTWAFWLFAPSAGQRLAVAIRAPHPPREVIAHRVQSLAYPPRGDEPCLDAVAHNVRDPVSPHEARTPSC
jgi:4'-phosphopantetheinyl transferase